MPTSSRRFNLFNLFSDGWNIFIYLFVVPLHRIWNMPRYSHLDWLGDGRWTLGCHINWTWLVYNWEILTFCNYFSLFTFLNCWRRIGLQIDLDVYVACSAQILETRSQAFEQAGNSELPCIIWWEQDMFSWDRSYLWPSWWWTYCAT